MANTSKQFRNLQDAIFYLSSIEFYSNSWNESDQISRGFDFKRCSSDILNMLM